MNTSNEQTVAEIAELKFYRVLAKFSQKMWTKVDNAEECSQQLFDAVNELLQNGIVPSDELISHLAITINAMICPNYTFLHSIEQRSLPIRYNYDHRKMEKAFLNLYNILNRVGFERVHRQINGYYFCTNPDQLFVCPRLPPRKTYEYTPHIFVLPTDQEPKHIPFLNLQHVVHNIDDVLSILNLRRNGLASQLNRTTTAEQHLVAEFIGGPNHAYHGPPMVWFAILPPEQSLVSSQFLSPSLDYKNSSYGCYRFSIPFSYFLKYKAYILGTRKYDEEYCHTIMLTDSNVQSVQFMQELEPKTLTETNIITETNGSFQWLCYRDTEKAWDQLDFSIAVSSLKCDPIQDKIRLNFVDHKNCIRDKYLAGGPACIIRSRAQAMEQFLSELDKDNITLTLLKPFFDKTVYDELQNLQRENNRS
ncbi:unnamed protein product [Rotaria socialis]|uniref:Uncharacterized protein n=1 Tax=Rotaria socialis TaxID=392032 RepID=A0A820SX47_9BILA|nr:unnamed protein product [Rotaria socialis]CAF4461402.1 unnamed protein product [Rotaria socialis]